MRNKYRNRYPEISVLMMTCDRPHLINEAIDSILGQTYRNFELIIVDASDNKHTQKIVSEYKDTRISYVASKGNIAAGRNVGLKRAKGRYVTYCDDDERYYRVRLAELKYFLDKNPNVGLVYTDTLAMNGRHELFRIEYDYEKSHLEAQCFFGVGNVMHRKECVEKVGYYDERLFVADDWDMWLRIADCYEIARLPKVLHAYLIHGENVTLKKRRETGEECESLIRKILRNKTRNKKELQGYIVRSSLAALRNMLESGRSKFAAYFVRKYCGSDVGFQSIACKGLYELSRRDYRKAVSYLRRAAKDIALDRNYRQCGDWEKENIGFVFFYLAQGYVGLGNISMAIKAAKSALSFSKQQCITLLLARCYLKIGLYKKALIMINGIQGGSYNSINLKGVCYLFLKDIRKAIYEFENAIQFYPEFTIARYNLALAYESMGSIDKSIAECERILAMDPGHSLARKIIKKYSGQTGYL